MRLHEHWITLGQFQLFFDTFYFTLNTLLSYLNVSFITLRKFQNFLLQNLSRPPPQQCILLFVPAGQFQSWNRVLMQCLIEKYKYMFNLIAFFKILNVGTHTMGDELKFCYGCNQFLSRWTVLRHAKYKTCVNTAVENIHVRKRKRRGSESAGLGYMFYFNRN